MEILTITLIFAGGFAAGAILISIIRAGDLEARENLIHRYKYALLYISESEKTQGFDGDPSEGPKHLSHEMWRIAKFALHRHPYSPTIK